MKKIFSLLVIAAITLTAGAQNNELKTFDGKLFSCQYPANFEAQEQWMDEAFNASIEDGIEFFSASVASQDMSLQDLKEWGEGMQMMTEKSFGEPTGWKAGQLVIKGKQLTFRSEGEEGDDDDEEEKVSAVKYTYCVVTPDKHTFCGELKFPKKDEAKYKPLFDKILASLKAK